jgi:predicted PurR-regulated permease PerM
MTWLNERHKKMIKTVLQIVLVLLILYLLLTKLLLFFAPFIIAFLIACIIEKPAGFMQKRFGFSRGSISRFHFYFCSIGRRFNRLSFLSPLNGGMGAYKDKHRL